MRTWAWLALITAASVGTLLHSHRTTGYHFWGDDMNNLGFYRTGNDDCHAVDDPPAPFGAIARKILLQPPEDWLRQFNTSVRVLPWLMHFTAHRLGDPENLGSGAPARPHFLLHYALFAAGIPVFYLLASLLFGRNAGLIASAFYSVNPINAGFLGWSYQTCDSLGILFALACCICHVHIARNHPASGKLRMASAASFLLLILTKESFLSLWAVIAVLHLHEDWRSRRSLAFREVLPRYARLLWPYLAMIAAFWILHRLYYGSPPQHHAQFDFSPKELFQKWFFNPYLGLTFWSLHGKGFLFEGALAPAFESLFTALWVGGGVLVAWQLRRRLILPSTALFCWLFFHAGTLHLILMTPLVVEVQRWMLYGSPGILLLMALSSEAVLARSRRLGQVLIGAVYGLLLLGFANNLDGWRDEQYLESVRIPVAVKAFYPEFPRQYTTVFYTKDGSGYRGGSRADKARVFTPPGYYGHLALQYWYPPQPAFCLIPHPGRGWDPLRPDQLHMVYEYARDDMAFYSADSAGNRVEVGRQDMTGIPKRR